MNKDIVWIDYARLLGIFLVIFGHALQRLHYFSTDETLQSIWYTIYLFHMPLFFLISGYLYCNKQVTSVRGGKILHSLIIPYLLYQVLYLPISVRMHYESLSDISGWMKMLMGIILGDAYDSNYSYFNCIPCWFIVCIIQIRLFFNNVQIKKWNSIFLIVFAFMFIWLQKVYGFDLLFNIDSTIMAIPFFLVGYQMKRFQDFRLSQKYQYIVIGFAMLILTIFIQKFNGFSQMNGPVCGKSVFLTFLGGFTGSAFILILSAFLSKSLRLAIALKTISRNTLFIIFSHWLFISVFSFCGVFRNIDLIIYNTTYALLAATSLSVIILFILYCIIQQVSTPFPFLLGKVKRQ